MTENPNRLPGETLDLGEDARLAIQAVLRILQEGLTSVETACSAFSEPASDDAPDTQNTRASAQATLIGAAMLSGEDAVASLFEKLFTPEDTANRRPDLRLILGALSANSGDDPKKPVETLPMEQAPIAGSKSHNLPIAPLTTVRSTADSPVPASTPELVRTGGKSRKFTDTDAEIAQTLHASNLSLREIARRLGTNHEQVRILLRRSTKDGSKRPNKPTPQLAIADTIDRDKTTDSPNIEPTTSLEEALRLLLSGSSTHITADHLPQATTIVARARRHADWYGLDPIVRSAFAKICTGLSVEVLYHTEVKTGDVVQLIINYMLYGTLELSGTTQPTPKQQAAFRKRNIGLPSNEHGVQSGSTTVARNPPLYNPSEYAPASIPVPVSLEPMPEVNGTVAIPEQITDHNWQEHANCVGTDTESFFPKKGESPSVALKVCESCRVQTQCLEYAIRSEEWFGIWGGTSERKRHKIIREHKGRNSTWNPF